jgi:hypothetical protein
MDKPKALVEITLHHVLDDGFASELRAFGISPTIIESLRVALLNMTNVMDRNGFIYARGMRQSLLDYGLAGIKLQTECMLSCMRKWRGEEARKHKIILRKWSK